MDSLDDLLVEEILQSGAGDQLDPSKVSELCRHINGRKIGGGRKAVRVAKRNISAKDPAVQLRALMLLDALVSNCQTAIHDCASERVVDDIMNVVSHGRAPAGNLEKANKLVKQLAEHIQVPSVYKEQFERLPSKGAYSDKTPFTSSSLRTSLHSLNDMDFQQTCHNGIQGLLKDLISSPQNEAHHIQKWLDDFSKRLLSKAEGVTAQVEGLLESTGLVELELHNAFNSFRGLSSSQFVENLVYEVDELEIANEDPKITEQGMPSQSYENDIVPRYKEAVTTAWRVYEQHICKPSAGASSSSNLRMQAERWRKQVPHIIGTEDFMRDNSCGLAEDRSFGMEISDFESDAERDGAAEIAGDRILPEEEWSGSESEVADEQAGSFKPSVSAALDFKAMLEAALRSPYIPQKVDAPTSKGTAVDHLHNNLVFASNSSTASTKISTAITTAADQIQRNVSKEGHGALQSDSSLEPHSQEQVSTLMDIVSKPIPQHAEIQKLRNWKEPISNDVLKGFHTPIMAGGLFDDENEDSDLFGIQSGNKWLHTAVSSNTGTQIEQKEKERGAVNGLLAFKPDKPKSELKALSSPKKSEIQSGNVWSHTAVSSDTGTQIEQKEKERGAVSDFLASEPDKLKSELKALSSPKKPSTFLAESYERVHDSLFANESTSNLTLKDTLSFFRKGLFEDDEDEGMENGDLFGPSNGAGIGSSSKEIHGSDLGCLMAGNIKGVRGHSYDSVITNTEVINESFESTGITRGVSIDEDEEMENGDLFGLSIGAGKIHGTDLGDLVVGNIKVMNSHSDDFVITNTVSNNESFESTRGASTDLQNKAALSKMPEFVNKKSETGSTNYNNLEGLSNFSREESTFSSLESLSETRRKLDEVGSVPFAHKSSPETMLGYPDYRSRLPIMMTQHTSNREKVLNIESGDDDTSTWSSASSTTDSLNLGRSCVEECLLNGVKLQESEQQTGNLEGVAEHPIHQVGEVTDTSRSKFSTYIMMQHYGEEDGKPSTIIVEPTMARMTTSKPEEIEQQTRNLEGVAVHPTHQVGEVGDSSCLTNLVKQQYGEEYGKPSTIIVEPTMASMTSSREKANEEPQKSSSNWSRKITSLQEHLGLQHTMFSPLQKRVQKTGPSTFVADALQENTKIPTMQTQRPSVQATSQDMNNLHHVALSRPRGPKRRAPTSRQSGSPVLMMHTQEINAGSSPEEELAGAPSPDLVVKEHDSIGKTEAFLRTDAAMLPVTSENVNIGGETGTEPGKHASDGSFSTSSHGEELIKSSKKATEVGSTNDLSAQKPQEGLLNTLVFEDEDDEDSLFGPLQGSVHSNSAGIAPSSKDKLWQGLPQNDEGSAKGEFLEGAAGKVLDQTFQGRSTVEHLLSPRESFRRSLFDDDDDEDDLFS